MTDELQYVKLALSVAETQTPDGSGDPSSTVVSYAPRSRCPARAVASATAIPAA